MNKTLLRRNALRTLLRTTRLDKQKDIVAALRKMGFNTSQALVSVDLRRMKAYKVRDNGQSYYVVPEPTAYKYKSEEKESVDYVTNAAVTSLEFAQHMAVVKTRPGMARGIAMEIDAKNLPAVAGTIAGHDTIFIAATTGIDADSFKEELRNALTAFETLLQS